MPFRQTYGHPTIPDESGLCDRCLSNEWSDIRQRANLWDVHQLRASVEDCPLPKPPRRKAPGARRR